MEKEVLGRRRLVGLALVLAAGACHLIPGTDAHDQAKAREAVASTLIDPSSAQFRDMRRVDGFVCGEVNGKDRMGAYAGFVRFYVDSASWTAVLDPQFDLQNLDAARRLCALSDFIGSACTRRFEEEAKQSLQLSFDTTWLTRCEASRPSASRVPYDPTRSAENAIDDLDINLGTTNVRADSIAEDNEIWFAPPEDSPLVDADGNPLNSADGEEPVNATEPVPKASPLDEAWLNGAIGRPSTQERPRDAHTN